jgi:hypothetical protein
MKSFVATLGAAFVLTVALASPAAADDELSVSNDGVAYARDLTAPLFDPGLRWVPGDVESSTFYVKNNDDFGARLDLDLLGDHIGDLLDSGDLHVTATAGTGFSGIASDGSVTRILDGASVPGGAVVPVTVTVSFDEDSPNATQLRSTDIRLRITLTQTEFPNGDDEDSDDDNDDDNGTDDGEEDDNGVLPDTGTGLSAWMLVLGGLTVGLGAAIARREPHTGSNHHG